MGLPSAQPGLAGLVGRLRGGHLAGTLWSVLNAGAAVLLPFGIFIFFAHALPPAEIGVVVLATSCAEIVKSFGMPGLYEALLQQKEDAARCHETALAALLLTGSLALLAYFALIAVLSQVVTDMAGHTVALDVIGVRIIADLVSMQPQAALAQRLAYRRLATRSIIANLCAGPIGIALALAGVPLTGLIAYLSGQSVLILLTTVIGSHALARPRLHRDCLRRMRKEATMASVVRMVAASNNYLDQIVIAGVIGSTRLAYFNIAKRVETTFITTASSFSGILFQPLFARRDLAGRSAGLRDGLATMTLLCGLPAAFLLVNNERVVPLVFGQDWLPAAPVVGVLALSGLARTLGSVHSALLSVSGRNRELARISTVSAVVGIAVVLAVARYGIIWCAAGLVVKSVCITTWTAWTTRRDLPDLVQVYAYQVFLPLALMALGAEAMSLLAENLMPIAALSASLAAGGLCGLACFARRFLRAPPLSHVGG